VTIFAQILEFFKLIDFKVIVDKYNSDKGIKSFDSWPHLVSMIFAHLSGASSLRELVTGIQLAGGSLNHLGMKKPPTRSNLSDANNNRPWQFFRDIFIELKKKLSSLMQHSNGSKRKFKFNNKIYSLDSSLISLTLEVYDWAKYKSRKGAVKLHALLDHQTYLPHFAVITTGKQADIIVAEKIKFPKDAIIVLDRAYRKFSFLNKLSEDNVFFVTRMKDNVQFKVIRKFKPPSLPGRPKVNRDTEDENIIKPTVIKDEYIVLNTSKAAEEYPGKLRLVTAIIEDKRTKKFMEMSFVTNNFHFSASTIAALYKERWAIESFFRKIKQNLRIKSFLGTSKNAVSIQLWVALITILLIEYLKHLSKLNWHISNLVFLLRLSLHSFYNLQELIDKPDRFTEIFESRNIAEDIKFNQLFTGQQTKDLDRFQAHIPA
jgi:hypothetical protein